MVFEKIRGIIAEQLGIDAESITMDTDFKNDLKADSLDLFQVINDIEEEYDVTIDDAEGLVTVGDAVRYVESAKK
jgi:acyl carrier protein